MEPKEPINQKETTEPKEEKGHIEKKESTEVLESGRLTKLKEFLSQKRLVLIPAASFLALVLCITIWFVVSSGKNRTPEPTPEPEPEPTSTMEVTPEPTLEPEPTPEPTPEAREGEVISKLTGEWVPEKVGMRRPYAVMINNIGYAAGFHSGISQASIMYEALVEGGITRCLAIFEDFDSKRIGSVRSARHYYVSFAREYDAIFVHYGHTKYAVAKMKELGTDNLSGLEGIGSTVFYRDNAYHAPHNAFASYKGIQNGMKAKKYRKKYKENQEAHFNFQTEDTDLESDKEAKKVTLKFSGYSYASPYFIYNEKKKTYDRYVAGGKHMDHESKKQLSFKNLIVQYVKEWNIDRNGYQTMKLDDAKGKGWYITNGKAVKITWEKKGNKGRTVYYDEAGSEIVINPGKTYIGVFPNDRMKDVVISKSKK